MLGSIVHVQESTRGTLQLRAVKMRSAVLLSLTASALAAPAAEPEPMPTAAPQVDERALPSIVNLSQLSSEIAAVIAGPKASLASGYVSLLSAVQPSATPANVQDGASRASSLQKAYPSNPVAAGPVVLLSGLTGSSDIDALRSVSTFGLLKKLF